MESEKLFAEYLHKNDLKNTPERMVILQEIMKLEKHFEAESLLDHFKNQQIKISRASIYRTLELLVKCGLINKINFNNNRFYYEPIINKKCHDHFICTNCGKIIEFYDLEIENIHQRLKQSSKVNISEYTHQIYGKCKECQ